MTKELTKTVNGLELTVVFDGTWYHVRSTNGVGVGGFFGSKDKSKVEAQLKAA